MIDPKSRLWKLPDLTSVSCMSGSGLLAMNKWVQWMTEPGSPAFPIMAVAGSFDLTSYRTLCFQVMSLLNILWGGKNLLTFLSLISSSSIAANTEVVDFSFYEVIYNAFITFYLPKDFWDVLSTFVHIFILYEYVFILLLWF